MRLPMEDDAARMLPPSLAGNINALLRTNVGSWCGDRGAFLVA